jgi:site-specific DNA-adenine methylase
MIETPMNYTGSKFKLLEQLLPEFDYTKPYFIDLFTGGGSVYTNMISGVIQHGGNRSWILDRLISDGFKYKELNFDYKKINKSGVDKKTKDIIIMNY